MTVTKEQIQALEDLLSDYTTEDQAETLGDMVAKVKDWQPELFEWLSHKYQTVRSPNALFGVAIFSLILIRSDDENE